METATQRKSFIEAGQQAQTDSDAHPNVLSEVSNGEGIGQRPGEGTM